jgi:hypothetical protein
MNQAKEEFHTIYHMSSFSRSGETLMLRCLNAHPDLHITHNLNAKDNKAEIGLFHLLAKTSETSISHENQTIQKAGVKTGNIIVLKNASWTHKSPFKGFVLVRNPISVANSFGFTSPQFTARMKKFCEGIEPKLMTAMNDEVSDRISQFCMLYNLKMSNLSSLGLPIVRYEDFVARPETVLRTLLEDLSIPWHDNVINSHELYNEGDIGHGGIKLWKPIHQGSLNTFKKLGEGNIAKIYGLTYPTMKQFGYDYNDGELILS